MTGGTAALALLAAGCVPDEPTSPNNQAPLAVIVASPSTGVAPLQVDFSAAASIDPDGTIVTYEWDFGDGSTATDPVTTHTFTTIGTITVSLTVTDDRGASATGTRSITVDPPTRLR